MVAINRGGVVWEGPDTSILETEKRDFHRRGVERSLSSKKRNGVERSPGPARPEREISHGGEGIVTVGWSHQRKFRRKRLQGLRTVQQKKKIRTSLAVVGEKKPCSPHRWGGGGGRAGNSSSPTAS